MHSARRMVYSTADSNSVLNMSFVNSTAVSPSAGTRQQNVFVHRARALRARPGARNRYTVWPGFKPASLMWSPSKLRSRSRGYDAEL